MVLPLNGTLEARSLCLCLCLCFGCLLLLLLLLLLDAQAPPQWPNNGIHRLKYYVLQLRDPNPNAIETCTQYFPHSRMPSFAGQAYGVYSGHSLHLLFLHTHLGYWVWTHCVQ